MSKPLQHVFQYGHIWWNYYQKHKYHLRDAVVDTMIQLLSCGKSARGYLAFECSDTNCTHTKIIPFTCKSRFCPSCGKKASINWVNKQLATLPNTGWQHITFTMPNSLWRLFDLNRHLLSELSAIAASCIQDLAKQKDLTPGIFTALHTFGRDLKWNPHIHLSTTCGGYHKTTDTWRTLYFKKNTLMKMWRYRIIKLLRQAYKDGRCTLPDSLTCLCFDSPSFNQWLNRRYHKIWIVHCAKRTNHHTHTVKYLGRYIKRPPIGASKLIHYDGRQVAFNYLNHNNKKHQIKNVSSERFIALFTQHIPEKNARLIRYYGFLANRVRKTLLPKVYTVLNQSEKNQHGFTFASMYKHFLGESPLDCIVCKSKLVLKQMVPGMNKNTLATKHESLALMKVI